MRPSYLYIGNSYTGNMISLYWYPLWQNIYIYKSWIFSAVMKARTEYTVFSYNIFIFIHCLNSSNLFMKNSIRCKWSPLRWVTVGSGKWLDPSRPQWVKTLKSQKWVVQKCYWYILVMPFDQYNSTQIWWWQNKFWWILFHIAYPALAPEQNLTNGHVCFNMALRKACKCTFKKCTKNSLWLMDVV